MLPIEEILIFSYDKPIEKIIKFNKINENQTKTKNKYITFDKHPLIINIFKAYSLMGDTLRQKYYLTVTSSKVYAFTAYV